MHSLIDHHVEPTRTIDFLLLRYSINILECTGIIISRPNAKKDIVFLVIIYYFSLLFLSITNPTLLLGLAFCLAAWWFIAIKNNSENVKLLGKWMEVCYITYDMVQEKES